MSKKTRCLKTGYLVILAVCISLLCMSLSYAMPVSGSYEGGIAAAKDGQTGTKKEYDYKETIFITGKPVTLSGKLVITTKSGKSDTITRTYQYSKLQNLEENIELSRTVELVTTLVVESNGQVIEKTTIGNKKPTEVIKTPDDTFTLSEYSYSRSVVVDRKPAVDYYAGNITSEKVYRTGRRGLFSSGEEGYVKVTTTGRITGYASYWGSAETQSLMYSVESESKDGDVVDKWGGAGVMQLSSSTSKQFGYEENELVEISFAGGFVQTEKNISVAAYRVMMPEFDASGRSTDRIVTFEDTLRLESFPELSRLMVPEISHLRGHWAERDVELLYSLKILKDDPFGFDPEQYVSRAEFADAVNLTAKEVPQLYDIAGNSGTSSNSSSNTSSMRSSTARNKQPEETSVFIDVHVGNPYISSINNVFNRNLMSGTGVEPKTFSPDERITVAQAITIFVRALGLENMAPNPNPVTRFADNDQIPDWARRSVYVAEQIGLAAGDEMGYLHPNQPLTKARAAKFLTNLINYMSNSLAKSYIDQTMIY